VVDAQGQAYATLRHGNEKATLSLFEFGEEGKIFGFYGARSFGLNNNMVSGGPRISLLSKKALGTSLSLTGYDGNNVNLNANKFGSSLALKDEKGNSKLNLNLSPNGQQSSISFLDQNEQFRLVLWSSDDFAFINFFDQDGKERVSISARGKRGSIDFSDKYGNLQAAIGELEGKGVVIP